MTAAIKVTRIAMARPVAKAPGFGEGPLEDGGSIRFSSFVTECSAKMLGPPARNVKP